MQQLFTFVALSMVRAKDILPHETTSLTITFLHLKTFHMVLMDHTMQGFGFKPRNTQVCIYLIFLAFCSPL